MLEGLIEFVKKLNYLKQIKLIEEITLTTNATLLKENINNIKYSGIDRINVSLDTLEEKKFKK